MSAPDTATSTGVDAANLSAGSAEPVITPFISLGQTGGDADLSLLSLLLDADLIVKLVMIGLLLMSVWCWAIIIEKASALGGLRLKADRFEEEFWSSGSLDSLYDRIARKPTDPMASTFVAGMQEWRRAAPGALAKESLRVSLRERIQGIMGLAISREMTRLERRLPVLASVGSTAPFIGLFGTVWGILNSFLGIAESQNTNLATVAPGIAEALFATAMGLVAAIPATIAYNKFAADLARYNERLDNFSTEFGTILGRHLEEARSASGASSRDPA